MELEYEGWTPLLYGRHEGCFGGTDVLFNWWQKCRPVPGAPALHQLVFIHLYTIAGGKHKENCCGIIWITEQSMRLDRSSGRDLYHRLPVHVIIANEKSINRIKNIQLLFNYLLFCCIINCFIMPHQGECSVLYSIKV